MPDDIAVLLVSIRYNTSTALNMLHTLINKYPQFANDLNVVWTKLEDEHREVTRLLEH